MLRTCSCRCLAGKLFPAARRRRRAGLQPAQGGGSSAFRPESAAPWHRSDQTDRCLGLEANGALRSREGWAAEGAARACLSAQLSFLARGALHLWVPDDKVLVIVRRLVSWLRITSSSNPVLCIRSPRRGAVQSSATSSSGRVGAMVLRSLLGKLRGLLPGRAAASRAAASDPDMDLGSKLESSVEAKFQAVRKSIRERARLRHEESEKRIRKDYRDAAIIVVTTVGFITFFWSSATEDFADALDAMEAKRMKMLAEAVKAMDEDREGQGDGCRGGQGKGGLGERATDCGCRDHCRVCLCCKYLEHTGHSNGKT